MSWRRDVRAAIDLRPFGAPLARSVLDVKLADGENRFVLPAQAVYGHFTVIARPCGTVAAETSAGTTVYRVRMPWRDILPGFRPAKGKSLAFNLRCPFAASRTDWTAAPYMLVLQKQKSRIFQMYHAGFLDSCRQLRLD